MLDNVVATLEIYKFHRGENRQKFSLDDALEEKVTLRDVRTTRKLYECNSVSCDGLIAPTLISEHAYLEGMKKEGLGLFALWHHLRRHFCIRLVKVIRVVGNVITAVSPCRCSLDFRIRRGFVDIDIDCKIEDR